MRSIVKIVNKIRLQRGFTIYDIKPARPNRIK